MTDSSKRVAVIGGGLAGLAVAHELLSRKFPPPFVVDVYEAASRPGGNIRTERAEGYVCEWGPEGFLDNGAATLKLAGALGLDARLAKANPEAERRYILRAGRLRELHMKPPRFLASDVLPLGAKARLLVEPFLAPRRDAVDESVFDFAARRLGRGAAEILVDSMVSGVFAGDAKRLSVESAFPRIREMEREHGSLFRALIAMQKAAKQAGAGAGSAMRPVLTSFDTGMETLTEALAGTLLGKSEHSLGASRIHVDRAVDSIQRTEAGYSIRFVSGESAQAGSVVISATASAAAKFLSSISPPLGAALGRIAFAPIAVLGVGYKRAKVRHPLDGFGFLIPRREGLKTLGVLWPSSTFANRAPEGHVLLRAMIGGATWPEAIDLSDGELLELFRREIGPILGVDGDPAWLRVFRFRTGIAQYNVGHREILAELRTELAKWPGLFLTGTSYQGISVNQTTERAPRAADAVLAFLDGATRGEQLF